MVLNSMTNAYAKQCVITIVLSVVALSVAAPSIRTDVHACRAAYSKCKLYFDGLSKISTLPLEIDIHVSFTARIASKRKGQLIGHVYSKGFSADVVREKGFKKLSDFGGKIPVSDNSFNSYALQGVTGSGIQSQALQKSQILALRHKCIRMYFSSYLILFPNGSVKKTVSNLGRSDNYCVVFRAGYAQRRATDPWPAVDVFI